MEICELVPSQKGNDKLNAHGFLMVKERNQANKYTWCCEKRKSERCKGRATTILENGLHFLMYFSAHSHCTFVIC
jgi:hypothetical protein